ncbi:CRISPR-associated helicase Cas3' [Nocardioides campestrisoli]|uniref:CRISPR-associated helicase Cas3' n=1 Tax=Nocardioides campestrisoli TaxID=2736757 RepID=UPI00163D6D06|nr:CRISPR-associated helicase Cas3' [Nocardioides campestrisoli]
MTAPKFDCSCHEALYALWAKDPDHLAAGFPPYAPTPHLLDTSVAMESLWRTWLRPGLRDLVTAALYPGDEASTVRALQLLAGLHDVGKVNPFFQTQPFAFGEPAWRTPLSERLTELGLPLPSGALMDLARTSRLGEPKGHGGSVATRHEYVGAYALRGRRNFTEREAAGESWIPTAVSGHHGRWRAPEDPLESMDHRDETLLRATAGGHWAETLDHQRQLIEQAIGVRLDDIPPMTGARSGPALVLVSGLLILADWVASDDGFVAAGKRLIAGGLDPITDADKWMQARREGIDAHVARTVGSLTCLDSAEEVILGGHPPRPLQQAAIDIGPDDGLWMVAFPTGEGKTKAAQLRHIQRPDEHLLFALPTMATTDAMAETLRRDFHPTGNLVIKSHQHASFSQLDSVTPEDARLYADHWFTTSARRLVAPIAVTTCDQVLSAALNQKSTHLRLLAVANHHVVFDEVHTFDAYQRELLVELLAWLGATGARVTLLSASIPHQDAVDYRNAYVHGLTRDRKRKAVVPYESRYPGHSLIDVADDGELRDEVEADVPLSAPVEPVGFVTVTSTEVATTRAEWALQQMAEHPRCHVAVVCNQVDSTVETARAIAASLPDGRELIVLHSRMTRSQRSQVESLLRGRLGPPPRHPGADAPAEAVAAYESELAGYITAPPVVVVATQIIEASLDLDFDIMGSDLAPSPSLVQRAGRLWRFRDEVHRVRRHGAAGPSRTMTVFVATNKDGSLSARGMFPYSSAELRKVHDLVTSRPLLRIPEDVQSFVDDGRVTIEDLNADVAWAAEVQRDFGAKMQMVASANVSKAKLLKDVIAAPTLTYGALMSLTRLPDDEDAMRTRYIDVPGSTFIVFDSGQNPSEFVAAGPVPANIMRGATGDQVRAWQKATLPASGRHRDDLLALHAATLASLGIEEWKPKAAVLERQLPVDLALWEAAARARQAEDAKHPMGAFDDLLGWA